MKISNSVSTSFQAYQPTSPSESSFSGSSSLSFDERLVTKYLTREQREQIERQEITPSELENYVSMIHSPEGMSLITQDIVDIEKYPILALRAFLNQQITLEQFATQCMFYSAMDQMIVHPARYEVRMNFQENKFEHYKISADLRHLPRLRVEAHSIHQLNELSKRYLKEFFHSTNEGIDLLIEHLKDIPYSESYFLVFELPVGPIANWSPLYHRINQITNIFYPVNAYEQWSGPLGSLQPQLLVIPSFSILKKFLKLALPESSMDIQPALGQLTPQTITENKLDGVRLINIGMPGADVPEKADGWLGGKIIFILHDFYHALRDCICPDYVYKAVKKITYVADQLLSSPTLSQEEKGAVKHTRWKLIDGELLDFEMKTSHCAHVSNLGVIFSKCDWPKVYLQAVQKEIDENKSVWSDEFHFTSHDYRDLQDAISKRVL